jgi:glycosyltransferase involved in cell wall biosynthesis
MRISIIGSRGYPHVYSGYETLIKELSERLVKQGVKVTVYCHRNLFEERPKQVNGVDLVYMPTIETKSLSQLIHSFFSITHACFSNTDVVLVVNSANGPFGLITRLFRKPTAINVDGLEWLRPKWKGLGAAYFKWASKQATKWYDQIINDSDEMRRVYLELFNKESKVIAYGANIRSSTKPELIKKWNLDHQGYYLIVGRLIPDNNADLIIEGFLKSNSNCKLVVVGDVPYSDTYASRLKALKDHRLIFTGYVTNQEELAELYHNSFAYFHGHEFGGTNPTMLKAMAYGTAILALDTPFNQEMLQEGKYGDFFSKNTEDVTRCIYEHEETPQLLTNLRANARNGLTEKYNWDYVTSQYLEVFRNLKKRQINQ